MPWKSQVEAKNKLALVDYVTTYFKKQLEQLSSLKVIRPVLVRV